jgi:hypothetical protein
MVGAARSNRAATGVVAARPVVSVVTRSRADRRYGSYCWPVAAESTTF